MKPPNRVVIILNLFLGEKLHEDLVSWSSYNSCSSFNFLNLLLEFWRASTVRELLGILVFVIPMLLEFQYFTDGD